MDRMKRKPRLPENVYKKDSLRLSFFFRNLPIEHL